MNQLITVVSLTVVCSILVIRQCKSLSLSLVRRAFGFSFSYGFRADQTLDLYWNQTSQQVLNAYETAQQQCQLDQWELCESPRFDPVLMWDSWTMTVVSLEHDTAVLQATTTTENEAIDTPVDIQTEEKEPNKPQLSSSTTPGTPELHSLRTARRLTEETPCFHQTFPNRCLQTAWINQRVRPACSRSLHYLHDIVLTQQQQERTSRMFKTIFGSFWVVLMLLWVCWMFQTNESELKQCDSYCCDKERDADCLLQCCLQNKSRSEQSENPPSLTFDSSCTNKKTPIYIPIV